MPFSASTLKLLAAGTMVIDHVGLLFFPDLILFRVIGRLSFPLFAFLIAEGFRKTSDVSAYFRRLFVLAAVSQIPYALFLDAANVSPPTLNIFFTLSGGLLALLLIVRIPPRFSIPLVLIIGGIAEWLHFDYGIYGIATILASFLVFRRKSLGLITLFLLPILYSLTIFAQGEFTTQLFAIVSVLFIAGYNGEKGFRLPRFFFYGLYPLHLLLLLLIWFTVR